MQVVARPGGFSRAVGLVLGLMLFGIVFIIGMTLGVGVMAASSEFGTVVIEHPYRDGTRGRIAIIPLAGMIDADQAEFVREAADHVLNAGGFDAVVLRVDSPGGGVAPSDQIWYEMERLKNAAMPVVASYGGVAASGGYYVSCGADAIVAEPTCITGSIGVIAQVFTFSELADKIGVEPVTLVATGSPDKDVANDLFRSWNEHDRQKIRTVLDAAYDTFRKRVSAGRGDVITDQAQLDAVASGSIYTARQALDHGLVDAVGYLDDAIARAEQAAALPTGRAEVVRLEQPPTLFGNGLLMRANRGEQPTGMLDGRSIRSILNDLSAPRIMYLMH